MALPSRTDLSRNDVEHAITEQIDVHREQGHAVRIPIRFRVRVSSKSATLVPAIGMVSPEFSSSVKAMTCEISCISVCAQASFCINLTLDPFERFIHSRGYDEWAEDRSWILGQAGKAIAKIVATFKEYPPSLNSMSVQVTGISDLINTEAVSR